MKQTIYVICESTEAFTTFAGFANFIKLKNSALPKSVAEQQSKWYAEHSEHGRKPVKVKVNVDFMEFFTFVFVIHQWMGDRLYCQNGVFVLK